MVYEEMPQACCFTGHRILPAGQKEQIMARLAGEIERLYACGVTDFYSGGALGFDTLAAQAVLGLKDRLPGVRLHLILPCKNQHARWRHSEQDAYTAVLSSADSVKYISEEYFEGCMHLRNRALVDKSRYCVCWLSHSRGGTAYTVRQAYDSGLEIINLYMAEG